MGALLDLVQDSQRGMNCGRAEQKEITAEIDQHGYIRPPPSRFHLDHIIRRDLSASTTVFSLNGSASSLIPRGHLVFPMLAYFSFITLTAVGDVDISPLTLQARYAACSEGVTGQFYTAILVVRLVSMQLVRVSTVHSSDASATGHDLRGS